MKGRLFAFACIFCIASLFVLGQEAQGKPDKPFEPGKLVGEWIEFYGEGDIIELWDLAGGEVVKGCCPNAGPFPPYTMTLGFDVPSMVPETPGYSAGTPIDGWLYINYYGAGRDQKYKVQFWTNYEHDMGIEIIGGVINHDRKRKILTVTFTNEECVRIKTKTLIKYVNFTLIRHNVSE